MHTCIQTQVTKICVNCRILFHMRSLYNVNILLNYTEIVN